MQRSKSLHLQLITLAAVDLSGGKEITDLEEAPGASLDADRLRHVDQRGFFIHQAIFFV